MHDNEYKTIILHIGTNDLVREDADKVAEKMEELIEEMKRLFERRVAVSSVIKRYDGRVPPSKIASYNNSSPVYTTLNFRYGTTFWFLYYLNR